jgi:hypothetical protein
MDDKERAALAETLQNKTALSRMSHGEIVTAIEFLESAGYEVTKKPVYEEQTFQMPVLAETAVIEGDDHA